MQKHNKNQKASLLSCELQVSIQTEVEIAGGRRSGEGVAVEWRPAAVAAVSLTASRQHIHQAPTMLRERNRNLQ